MRQIELDRAVAASTGESVATVRRLGFLLADVPLDAEAKIAPDLEELLERPVIDWERFSITQRVAVTARKREGAPVGS